MLIKRLLWPLLAAFFFALTPARAQEEEPVPSPPPEKVEQPSSGQWTVQKSGKQEFPGKMMVGFKPVGFNVFYGANGGSAGYKLAADFSGAIAEIAPDLKLWLGGGVNYAAVFGIGCGCHDLQLFPFVMLTINKIKALPLVPWVRAGLPFDIFIWGNVFGNWTYYAFGMALGGGVDYWLFRSLGLGVETNFSFGGAFGGPFGAPAGFLGAWDFLMGARYVFGG